MNAGPIDRSALASARRRERTDLYATILEVVKRYHGEGRVTRISYGAGMPVDRLRTALERMVALGLVRTNVRDDRTTYDLTPRGQEFLTVYWKMKAYTDLLEERWPPP